MNKNSIRCLGLPLIILAAAVLTVKPAPAQSNDRARDSHQRFDIVLEIAVGDGATIIGGFESVSGLNSETEIIEFREGGDPEVVRKLPGRTTYSNIVLKRGVIDAAQNDLWTWRRNVIDGVADRRDGAVILLKRDGTEAIRYSFFNAFPSAWKGFSPERKGTDVAVEEIVLAVERIERVQ